MLDQRVALVLRVHPPQVFPEDDLIRLARAVDVQDVAQGAAALDLAQHRPDRRHTAPGANHQDPLGQGLGHAELTLDLAEEDHLPRRDLPGEVGRHQALGHVLDGDGYDAVGMVGIRGQGVGPPVSNSVDLGTDAQVLPRPVSGPREARPHHDGGGVLRLGLDASDRAGQLGCRPAWVQQAQVVIGYERRRHRPRRSHDLAPKRGRPGGGTALDHDANLSSQVGPSQPEARLAAWPRVERVPQ
jgi:hypothetical protein